MFEICYLRGYITGERECEGRNVRVSLLANHCDGMDIWTDKESLVTEKDIAEAYKRGELSARE